MSSIDIKSKVYGTEGYFDYLLRRHWMNLSFPVEERG